VHELPWAPCTAFALGAAHHARVRRGCAARCSRHVGAGRLTWSRSIAIRSAMWARSATGPKRHPRSLAAAEGCQLRALLTYDDKAVESDLPDLVAMLATGLLIGECAALTWENVELNAGTVTVQSTLRLQSADFATPTKMSLASLMRPPDCHELGTTRAVGRWSLLLLG
jgi:integrase